MVNIISPLPLLPHSLIDRTFGHHCRWACWYRFPLTSDFRFPVRQDCFKQCVWLVRAVFPSLLLLISRIDSVVDKFCVKVVNTLSPLPRFLNCQLDKAVVRHSGCLVDTMSPLPVDVNSEIDRTAIGVLDGWSTHLPRYHSSSSTVLSCSQLQGGGPNEVPWVEKVGDVKEYIPK